jgi:hypothetical protein
MEKNCFSLVQKYIAAPATFFYSKPEDKLTVLKIVGNTALQMGRS